MPRPHRTRLFASTMSISRFVLVAVVLLACANASAQVRGGTRSAPPSHSRSGADAHVELRHAARADPVPDPAAGSEVSLEGILAFADRRSPVLTVARSTRSRAEAARVGASLRLPTNPEVSVAVGPRIGVSGTGVDVDVSLMQQIQIAGERGARLDAANALRDLTEAEIEVIRWAVHCDVHAAFHRAIVDQERMRLAERVVSFQREVSRVVDRQIAAGEASPLALRLARAEVAQAEQVLVAAQQAFFASRVRLAQLSGWPVDAPPMPVGAAGSPADPPPLDRLREVAQARLPSLRANATRIREAEARSTLADREAWPRPSLGVQYRREGNPSAEGAYDVVMGVVSIPIPSFQRNQGDRARARADVTVAEAELEASRRLLDGELAAARSEVAAAAARARAYGTEILPLFEESLALLQRSFELGEIDLLALAIGRERLLRIQSDALGAQQDYFVALARLERVVGVDLRDHEESTR